MTLEVQSNFWMDEMNLSLVHSESRVTSTSRIRGQVGPRLNLNLTALNTCRERATQRWRTSKDLSRWRQRTFQMRTG